MANVSRQKYSISKIDFLSILLKKTKVEDDQDPKPLYRWLIRSYDDAITDNKLNEVLKQIKKRKSFFSGKDTSFWEKTLSKDKLHYFFSGKAINTILYYLLTPYSSINSKPSFNIEDVKSFFERLVLSEDDLKEGVKYDETIIEEFNGILKFLTKTNKQRFQKVYHAILAPDGFNLLIEEVDPGDPIFRDISEFSSTEVDKIDLLKPYIHFPWWLKPIIWCKWKISRWIKPKRHFKAMDAYFKYLIPTIQGKLQYFIPNEYRFVDGGANQHKGLEKFLWNFLDNNLGNEYAEAKYCFLMSESGGGKSTSLLKVFEQYFRQNPFFKNEHQLFLFEFSDRNLKQKILQIKASYIKELADRKKANLPHLNISLILDGLDEDESIINANPHKSLDKIFKRISEIKEHLHLFNKIIISCRKQVFEGEDNTKRLEQLLDDQVMPVYISYFTEEQSLSFLRKRYSSAKVRKDAEAIYKQFRDQKKNFLSTQLLLTFMDYLLRSSRQERINIQSKAQLIELIVKKWSLSEEKKLLALEQDAQEHSASMEATALRVAEMWYQHHSDYIIEENRFKHILFPEWNSGKLYKYRDFFTFKNDGSPVFAHRVIREFFVAKAAYENLEFDKIFDFDYSDIGLDKDDAGSLYTQMVWCNDLQWFINDIAKKAGFSVILFYKTKAPNRHNDIRNTHQIKRIEPSLRKVSHKIRNTKGLKNPKAIINRISNLYLRHIRGIEVVDISDLPNYTLHSIGRLKDLIILKCSNNRSISTISPVKAFQNLSSIYMDNEQQIDCSPLLHTKKPITLLSVTNPDIDIIKTLEKNGLKHSYLCFTSLTIDQFKKVSLLQSLRSLIIDGIPLRDSITFSNGQEVIRPIDLLFYQQTLFLINDFIGAPINFSSIKKLPIKKLIIQSGRFQMSLSVSATEVLIQNQKIAFSLHEIKALIQNGFDIRVFQKLPVKRLTFMGWDLKNENGYEIQIEPLYEECLFDLSEFLNLFPQLDILDISSFSQITASSLKNILNEYEGHTLLLNHLNITDASFLRIVSQIKNLFLYGNRLTFKSVIDVLPSLKNLGFLSIGSNSFSDNEINQIKSLVPRNCNVTTKATKLN